VVIKEMMIIETRIAPMGTSHKRDIKWESTEGRMQELKVLPIESSLVIIGITPAMMTRGVEEVRPRIATTQEVEMMEDRETISMGNTKQEEVPRDTMITITTVEGGIGMMNIGEQKRIITSGVAKVATRWEHRQSQPATKAEIKTAADTEEGNGDLGRITSSKEKEMGHRPRDSHSMR
jgi:hypothetical protein